MLEDSETLEFMESWPHVLSDASELCKNCNHKQITIQDCHPELLDFHSFFQGMIKKDSDHVFNIGKINLPLR